MGEYQEIEDRIKKAMSTIQHGKNPNIKALSREFNVPYERLRTRIRGTPNKMQHPKPHRRLTEAQEQSLIAWIYHLGEIGIPPTPRVVEAQAIRMLSGPYVYKIGQNAGVETVYTLGKTWIYDFMRRCPSDLKLIIQKPMEAARIEISAADVQNFYDGFERYVHDARPCNIYNFDESGFIIAQQGRRKVLSNDPYGVKKAKDLSTRELLTAIECVSADGHVLPPFFIVKGIDILMDWYRSDLWPEKGGKIATSGSGMTNFNLTFEWLKHFDEYTRDRIKNGKFFDLWPSRMLGRKKP